MTITRRGLAAFVLLLCGLLCPALSTADAQSPPVPPAAPSQPAQPATPPPKSFLPPAPRSGQPAATAPAAPSGFYGWVSGLQHDYNRRLARAVRDLKTGSPMLALLSLAGLSFAYGILHAAGPGHGKAVISSYVLASEQTVRRGILLSFLAALFQALSALVLVAILVTFLKATKLTIDKTEAWLETLSWALVALIGGWLVWRQLTAWCAMHCKASVAHSHDHGQGHDHSLRGHHQEHGDAHDLHRQDLGHAGAHHHRHDQGHHHAHDDACCDHAHMPDPKQLEGVWSWKKAVMLAAAVGIRPCTGAILVLVFAIGQGLAWAGVFATFAMALGTAITVSVLAALAISSRDLAERIGGGKSPAWATNVRRIAGLGGSLAVFVLGLMLFIGSLGSGSAL